MAKFKENPFKEETRNVPINFGYNIEEQYVLKLKIPKGFEVEDMPKPATINLPDKSGSFKFVVQKSGENQIMVMSRLRVNQPTFSAEFYPYLKQFFDMVAEKQNEQIVLKKIAE